MTSNKCNPCASGSLELQPMEFGETPSEGHAVARSPAGAAKGSLRAQRRRNE
jgi:hypothetical protein